MWATYWIFLNDFFCHNFKKKCFFVFRERRRKIPNINYFFKSRSFRSFSELFVYFSISILWFRQFYFPIFSSDDPYNLRLLEKINDNPLRSIFLSTDSNRYRPVIKCFQYLVFRFIGTDTCGVCALFSTCTSRFLSDGMVSPILPK